MTQPDPWQPLPGAHPPTPGPSAAKPAAEPVPGFGGSASAAGAGQAGVRTSAGAGDVGGAGRADAVGAAEVQAALGREIAIATLVVVVLALVGVLLGVLWQWVTPGAEVLMTNDGPVHANSSSENYFADDGWFMVIGAVAGVLTALGCWLLVRRYRGAVVLVGMVAGCLIGAVVAWQVGRHIGLAEFQRLLDHAPADTRFRRPAKLDAFGVLGVQGFTAAFTYTLLAGWSRWPQLRRPTPEEWAALYGPWQMPHPPAPLPLAGQSPYPAAATWHSGHPQSSQPSQGLPGRAEHDPGPGRPGTPER